MIKNLSGSINRTFALWQFSATFFTGFAVFISLAALALGAFGGTVITGNLPENTAIINISGTQDGSARYNGDQSLWYQPFNTGGVSNLLEYTVQPGVYGFRIIDPADAAQLYPTLTSNQLGQIYTGWTYNSPWVTDYLIFDSSAATNTSEAQLLDGAFSNTNGTWQTYANADAAYAAEVGDGLFDLIRPGPPDGRNGKAYTNTWTFLSTETLIFVVPDSGLGDNAGGVSVLVRLLGPAPPVLSIVGGTGTVTLLWPTNTVGFNLEQTPGLSPRAWSVVTNTPVTDSTNNSVTLPVESNEQFFRLHNP